MGEGQRAKAMRFFFDDVQFDHKPTQYVVHGKIVAPFENPNRAETLIAALERFGLRREAPVDFGLEPILAIHADHYVGFLAEAFDLFRSLPNAGPEVFPNQSAGRRGAVCRFPAVVWWAHSYRGWWLISPLWFLRSSSAECRPL